MYFTRTSQLGVDVGNQRFLPQTPSNSSGSSAASAGTPGGAWTGTSGIFAGSTKLAHTGTLTFYRTSSLSIGSVLTGIITLGCGSAATIRDKAGLGIRLCTSLIVVLLPGNCSVVFHCLFLLDVLEQDYNEGK